MNDATLGPLTIPFWKTFTFWISLGAWFVTVGGHYASVIPDPYGVIAANVVALVYAILRCLTKRKEGLPWKGILSTSEFTVTSATVAFNLVNSLAQIPAMPPKVLVGLSALSGLLVTVLHHLSGGNSFESKFGSQTLGSQTLGSQTLGSQTLSNADFLKIAQASLTPHNEELAKMLQGFPRSTSTTVNTLAHVQDDEVVKPGSLKLARELGKILPVQPGAPIAIISKTEAETPLEKPLIKVDT
jgi:hypothetical protein